MIGTENDRFPSLGYRWRPDDGKLNNPNVSKVSKIEYAPIVIHSKTFFATTPEIVKSQGYMETPVNIMNLSTFFGDPRSVC